MALQSLVMAASLAAAGVAAVAASIGELELRHAMPWLDNFFVLEPCERKLHYLAPGLLPGLTSPSRYRTNSRGIRGREFADHDAYRILVLGCSVTISVYVDQDRTWPHLTEERLSQHLGQPVWVGVVGRREMTSRDVVTWMRDFVPQYSSALDALVVQVAVNDLALMLSKGETYDPEFLARTGDARRRQRAFARLPARYTSGPSYRKLALWKAITCVKRRMQETVYRDEGAYYAERRRARCQAHPLRDVLPDMTVGLDEYECNLNTIVDLAQEQGLRLVLLTQPCLWRPDLSPAEEALLWFGWVGDTGEYYSARVLAHGLAQYNDRLRHVSEARRIEWVDLDAIIPHDLKAFYDDVHFNDEGSRLVGDAVSNHFNGEELR